MINKAQPPEPIHRQLAETYRVCLSNAKLIVPREELFTAIRHFVPECSVTSVIAAYLAAEQIYPEIEVTFLTIGLQHYIEQMYKEGRASGESINDQKARPALIDFTKRDYLND